MNKKAEREAFEKRKNKCAHGGEYRAKKQKNERKRATEEGEGEKSEGEESRMTAKDKETREEGAPRETAALYTHLHTYTRALTHTLEVNRMKE